MSLAVDRVIAAYTAMGRPGMKADDPVIVEWAQTANDETDIWRAAAGYINDANWHDIAVNAQALLIAAGATSGGTVATGASVFQWIKDNPGMAATAAFMIWKFIR